MKKAKSQFLILMVTIACVLYICKLNNRTPFETMQYYSNDVAELLFEEPTDGNLEVVFYLDDNGNIWCSILRKQLLGYHILRISGAISPKSTSTTGITSSFQSHKKILWVNWRIVTDSTVQAVAFGESKMNMTEITPYGYRICWLIGEGPIETLDEVYTEIK